MGNCCSNPDGAKKKKKKAAKPNPFSVDYATHNGPGAPKFRVLKEPTGRDVGSRYELGRELGRGEFGVTYLCIDKETGEEFACKSISKKKLKTAVDIEDVRREVDIMRHLPHHPNIVSLKHTYEDAVAVHLVMEFCEGGELFDRIVARGHYTERAAAGVTRTIVDVVQVLFLTLPPSSLINFFLFVCFLFKKKHFDDDELINDDDDDSFFLLSILLLFLVHEIFSFLGYVCVCFWHLLLLLFFWHEY